MAATTTAAESSGANADNNTGGVATIEGEQATQGGES